HYGARFLPWHRAFLVYFEQLLQAAVREHSLTLPYWNWTDQLTIPQQYTDPALMPIAPNTTRPLGTRPLNAGRTRISTILATHDFVTFGGGEQGEGGNLEFGPHGYVHNTVGGDTGWMSDIQWSPKDPIFYAHHANIDRVWSLWMQDPTHHNQVKESDRYTFVDPAGRPVEVSVAEILTWDIRYNEMPRLVSIGGGTKSRVLDQPLRTTFSIPAAAMSAQADVERSPATLQLENVVLPGDQPVTVDVFIEAASARSGGAADAASLVGSVSIVPTNGHHADTVDIHLAVPATLAPLLRSGRALQVRVEPVTADGTPAGELAFEGFTLQLH
ncbi:tyrosinase family protein, partial [Longimicrobium sp.]|uniref:tyrosinase family protein n=1 Tax=Longimicrobium sp. TaxID=2029185 RepID=UPI002F95D2D0